MAETLRIKFQRTGPVRYIGHLDMMRFFQKAVMRAGLNVRYSEGFNPHQIMSFAYPLGVSMETLGDYLDIGMISYDSCEAVVDSLNQVMAEGIHIISATALPEGAKNAMSSVAAADYLVHLHDPADNTSISTPDQETLTRFLDQETIMAAKESGKISAVTDIRPGILALEPREDNMLFMKLKSGSDGNLKPATVLLALSEYMSADLAPDLITRLEIYRRDEQDELIPLNTFL